MGARAGLSWGCHSAKATSHSHTVAQGPGSERPGKEAGAFRGVTSAVTHRPVCWAPLAEAGTSHLASRGGTETLLPHGRNVTNLMLLLLSLPSILISASMDSLRGTESGHADSHGDDRIPVPQRGWPQRQRARIVLKGGVPLRSSHTDHRGVWVGRSHPLVAGDAGEAGGKTRKLDSDCRPGR